MTWPTPLPSVRQQWNMRSRGCLPQGNWNLWDSQGVTFHGDDLYLWSFRGQTPESISWEVEYLQLYRWVEGFGWERLTAGNRLATDADSYTAGTGASGNLVSEPIYWSYSDPCHVVSDGQYLYAYADTRWIRINPSTLDWEVVAGAVSFPDSSVDAPVGANARMTQVARRSYVHGGYLYFLDVTGNEYPVPDDRGWLQIRRMLLSSPYPVETMLTCGGPADLGDTDPATGLPYALNGDMLRGSELWALAIDGDYLYVLGGSETVAGDFFPAGFPYPPTGFVSALFRYQLTDMSQWDLLYYALDASNQGEWPRDSTTEYSSNAPYLQANGYENPVYPGVGTPDLEGFGPVGGSIAVTDARKLAFTQAPVFYAGFGAGVWGYTICLFDLGSLEAEFVASGPMRHNRELPFYETICNGTAGDESVVGWNFNNRQRQWTYRSGSTPLIQHPCNASLTSKGDSVWFLTPVITAFVGNYSWQDLYSAHFAVELSQVASTGPAIDVHLKFDGTELKGYSPQYPLVRQDPPEEVVLA